MSAAKPATTFEELINEHRPTVCALLEEAASSFEKFTKYFEIRYTRQYDTYDGMWIEQAGINQAIILAPTDSFFEKIKEIVLVEEKTKKIANDINVYEVFIPAIRHNGNCIVYDNDQEHNDFAKAFTRFMATNDVLSAFTIDVLHKTDDYVNRLFRQNQGVEKNLRIYLEKAYNEFRDALKAYCR